MNKIDKLKRLIDLANCQGVLQERLKQTMYSTGTMATTIRHRLSKVEKQLASKQKVLKP